ncbi:MAG: rod shape-determining protein RodA [Bacteroidales bacterium]|jgi:rod shape determining protein RodA|nr:rod shape-determining protein RodA [Bacteroidales bacterium]MBQ4201396.1 rod shape-determining protein RodA [Bacteroidales bacterium]
MQEDALDRGLKKTVDWRLIVVYLALMLFGWINIYAAVQSGEPSSIFDLSCNSGKQALWMGGAIVLAALVLFVISSYFWESISNPAYLVVLVLLVLVIFMSHNVKGSHSWFELGPVKFQPAELSKITTSLLLASIMSRPGFKMSNIRHFIIAALIVLIPMLVIVAESETGSALVYAGFVFVLYREGLSGWFIGLIGMAILLFVLTIKTHWWISLIVVGVAALYYFIHYLRRTSSLRMRRRVVRNGLIAMVAGVVLVFAADFFFHHVLKDYQRERIEVVLGMKEDLKGVGYNVHQSLIAIGSGGLTGKGYLQGTQTSFGFVPEQSTDFIFCTVGEEWGFMGSLAVIVLYGLMIFWIVQDSERARSSFTRIYGYCVASCLFMHLFINIGMTIGLMPVIGIPLPFFSYGGSSLWAFTTMLFIFIALDRQEKKYF